MSNGLQSLSDIFSNRIFRIPDYQRGYAWQKQQLVDFWEDLVNLQPDRYHYTGLVSLKPLKRSEIRSWGEDLWLVENNFKPYHIVDGQQRITTFVILLNEIVGFVRGLEENAGKSDEEITIGYTTLDRIVKRYICEKRPPNNTITTFLFGYEVDNPSNEYMRHRVFDVPYSGTIQETYYTKNLKYAKGFFAENVRAFYEEGGAPAIAELYRKLTQQLMFNLHEIEDDYDVFVAFETMNNRGKKLTNLELLKNRLIYLTTLYDDRVYDEMDKAALRRKINDAWKEVYFQLGRNKEVSLSDDDFLRAHWIIYYRYSRKRGDEYLTFLLNKFSAKGIFEKVPVTRNEEAELQIPEDFGDEEDSEEEMPIEMEESKLMPSEIEDYVNSLKETAQYWYLTFFPYDSDELSNEEKEWVDRLNRIGMGYFRAMVTVALGRKDCSAESRVELFRAMERFIFVVFRMGNFNMSYQSSDYNRVARELYRKEISMEEVSKEIYERTTADAKYASGNYVNRIQKLVSNGAGYYGWTYLKYFFYEYESTLAEKNKIDRICSWNLFTKSERDRYSVEHILPQTPSKYYWKNQFRQFTPEEMQQLAGALGNLLPLSQSVNSALQNESFEEKKHSKSRGRRGYENGSHSEIEVSKNADWDAEKIYQRSEKLLEFLQEHWNIRFSEEQMEQLIGLSFVHDGRVIPPELEEVEEPAQATQDGARSSRLEFWEAFVQYLQENGRGDIHTQSIGDRRYLDAKIGADGYHFYFNIPRAKSMQLGIYTYDPGVYQRLKDKKKSIEEVFGAELDWEVSSPTVKRRAIIIGKPMDALVIENRPTIFAWFVEMYDRMLDALSAAGETFGEVETSAKGKASEWHSRYWSYALPVIQAHEGPDGAFQGRSPFTDNWLNGYFGINGIVIACVAVQDQARVEIVFQKPEAEANKAAFDQLILRKDEIETRLGAELTWDRGAKKKSSKIYITLPNVSVNQEKDWPKMAQFQAEWSKKFCDVIVPYVEGT